MEQKKKSYVMLIGMAVAARQYGAATVFAQQAGTNIFSKLEAIRKSLHSADMPFLVAALKTYTAALENTIGEEGNKLSGEFQKIMCAARIDIDSGDSA